MTPLEQITEAVDELVSPRRNEERFTRETGHGLVAKRYVVHVASLLDQLGYGLTLSSRLDRNDAGHPIPSSRPSANVEALDQLVEIERDSLRILTYIGGTDRRDLVANLRALVGLTANKDEDVQRDVAYFARIWLSRAKVFMTWEVEPWRPDNSCPLCEQKRSLRIRIISNSEMHAVCVSCGEVWTPESIGLLAEHMRWENDELEEIA